MSSYYLISNTFYIDTSVFDFIVKNSSTVNLFFIHIQSVHILILFIVISAFVKSAQFGFHYWLPDSMEAPLPASALIHSATLVAAGINLLLRFSLLINFSDFFVNIILYYSSFTYLFGAICASFQTDLKKILAYSTISNCGLIISALYLSEDLNALFFFTVHGWFKSLSFIVCGHIIFCNEHKQDFRSHNIGKFVIVSQACMIVFTLCSLSSMFVMWNSVFKHYIFQHYFFNIVFKIFIGLGTVFSTVYALKLLYILKTTSVKSLKNDSKEINIYYLYAIYFSVSFATLFFFNYISINYFEITYVFSKTQVFFFSLTCSVLL